MAYLPQVLPSSMLRPFGLAVFAMACGFIYLAVTNGRMDAMESGGKTWWADVRLVHAGLLGTGSVYLFMEERSASIPLMLDVIAGIIFFFTIRLGVF